MAIRSGSSTSGPERSTPRSQPRGATTTTSFTSWSAIGRRSDKLRGKITLNVGLSDNFFLNNAVYRAEAFLKSATNPPADASVDYGSRDEHCWSGDHDHVNAVSRLTYNSRFIRLMADHWTRTAPAGADTTSWRY